MVYGLTDIVRNTLGKSANSDQLRQEEFWAVDDLSFQVSQGEILGIIGANGSGKSTVLKLLNGIYWPDRGKITLRGKVRALIELGAGFHPLLTGRENIYLNAAILGMKREEIVKNLEAIIEFAGIGEFMDRPAKYYSLGMWVRLGFSIALHTDPEILLLDEVLANADLEFHRKCIKSMEKQREIGLSVVMVSHDLALIRQLCDTVLWLEGGRMKEIGPGRTVCEMYEKYVGETMQEKNQNPFRIEHIPDNEAES